jgi:hypothetical protein
VNTAGPLVTKARKQQTFFFTDLQIPLQIKDKGRCVNPFDLFSLSFTYKVPCICAIDFISSRHSCRLDPEAVIHAQLSFLQRGNSNAAQRFMQQQEGSEAHAQVIMGQSVCEPANLMSTLL